MEEAIELLKSLQERLQKTNDCRDFEIIYKNFASIFYNESHNFAEGDVTMSIKYLLVAQRLYLKANHKELSHKMRDKIEQLKTNDKEKQKRL